MYAWWDRGKLSVALMIIVTAFVLASLVDYRSMAQRLGVSHHVSPQRMEADRPSSGSSSPEPPTEPALTIVEPPLNRL
jgi:hypothetical protein